jgi:succinyl-diaminopimelate desuccinylase
VVPTGDAETPRSAVLAWSAAREGPLILHGHYDVVPAFGPAQFVPRVANGRLIGRGSSDMKGGLASIVYGGAAAAERGARVQLAIVPDEETGGRLGAERLAALGRLDGAVGAIVGEPSWGTIWHACRGAFTLCVTVRGRPAHVGHHYEGRNAFEDAVEAVRRLRPVQEELRGRLSALAFASGDGRARESIMLVGGVASGGTSFNVVPADFSFTIDRRPNADEDYDCAKREVVEALAAARREGLDIEWEVLQDARSAVEDVDGPLAQALGEALQRVTGSAPPLTCCPGVLETRVYAARGIPALAFGPGLSERMHAPDEDVPLENLVAAAEIYADTAVRLVGA